MKWDNYASEDGALLVCRRCGAVVGEHSIDKHEDFHSMVQQHLIVAQDPYGVTCKCGYYLSTYFKSPADVLADHIKAVS